MRWSHGVLHQRPCRPVLSINTCIGPCDTGADWITGNVAATRGGRWRDRLAFPSCSAWRRGFASSNADPIGPLRSFRVFRRAAFQPPIRHAAINGDRMSKIQTGLPARAAQPASAKRIPDRSFGPAAAPDSEAWRALGEGNAAGEGANKLLSRPTAPQGRRSLFRR